MPLQSLWNIRDNRYQTDSQNEGCKISADSNAMKTESKILLECIKWGAILDEGERWCAVRLCFKLRSGQTQGKRMGMMNGRRAFWMEGNAGGQTLTLEGHWHVPRDPKAWRRKVTQTELEW